MSDLYFFYKFLLPSLAVRGSGWKNAS